MEVKQESPVHIDQLNELMTNLGKEMLEKWKDVKLNVGLIGNENEKINLLFINKLTGLHWFTNNLNEKDSQLKLTETSTPHETNQHEHLNNKNFVVWDLSSALNKNSNIIANDFDFFIIFRRNLFDDNDVKLAKEFSSKGKPVYFVRFDLIDEERQVETLKSEINKEALNVSVNEREKEDDFVMIDRNDKDLIEHFDKDFEEKLKKNNIIQNKIYYITSISTIEYSRLIVDILANLKEEKAQAFILTVEPVSHEIIEKKSNYLKTRVCHVSAISSLFGYLFSMPGVALVIDVTLVTAEIWFYLHQLGLNMQSLERFANSVGRTYDKMLQKLKSCKYNSFIFLKDIHSLSGTLINTLPLFKMHNSSDLVKLIPILGSFIHSVISYITTRHTLLGVIDEFAKTAMEIQTVITEQNSRAAYLEEEFV
jgi:hypothetical protein